MKTILLISILLTSCATIQHNIVENQDRLTPADIELDKENQVNYKFLPFCQKKIAKYFTDQIYSFHSGVEWKSCSEVLNNAQRKIHSMYWGITLSYMEESLLKTYDHFNISQEYDEDGCLDDVGLEQATYRAMLMFYFYPGFNQCSCIKK
jgi:hypothetical protein